MPFSNNARGLGAGQDEKFGRLTSDLRHPLHLISPHIVLPTKITPSPLIHSGKKLVPPQSGSLGRGRVRQSHLARARPAKVLLLPFPPVEVTAARSAWKQDCPVKCRQCLAPPPSRHQCRPRLEHRSGPAPRPTNSSRPRLTDASKGILQQARQVAWSLITLTTTIIISSSSTARHPSSSRPRSSLRLRQASTRRPCSISLVIPPTRVLLLDST